MKKWLNNLLIGTALLGTSSGIYTHQRKPVVLENTKVEGFDVEIVGKRNESFPGSQLLDDLIWGRVRTQTYKRADNGKIVISLNRSGIKQKGKDIQEDWESYVENHKAFLSENKTWDPEKEVTYRLLKNVARDNIAEAFASKVEASHINHELRHAKDGVDGFNLLDSEIRAYLTELMSSPSALRNLEGHFKLENKGRFEPHYRNAAENILSGLMNLYGFETKRKFYSETSDEKIAEGAKTLFDKWYPVKNKYLNVYEPKSAPSMPEKPLLPATTVNIIVTVPESPSLAKLQKKKPLESRVEQTEEAQVLFAAQFYASDKPLSHARKEEFSKILSSEVYEEKEKGVYKYTAFKSDNLDYIHERIKINEDLFPELSDSWIVAYINGQRDDMSKALSIKKKYKSPRKN